MMYIYICVTSLSYYGKTDIVNLYNKRLLFTSLIYIILMLLMILMLKLLVINIILRYY